MTARRTHVLGRVRPMDRPGRVLDWMVIDGGRIVDIGEGPPPAMEPGGADVLDLGERTIVPGLHDAHVHLLSTGLMDLDVDLSAASRFDDVFAILVAAVERGGRGILRAHSFDPDLLPDGRYPTVDELDAVSADRPIYVRRRDGHSSIANTTALELLDLPSGLDGVERSGSGPTGVLRGRAHSAAADRVKELLTDDERITAYRLAADRAASRGIAVVHALVGSRRPGNRDVELLLDVADALPIDVVVYAQTEDVDRVCASGLSRIGGCLLLDGSFSSGTAALSEPYADGGGLGNLYYDDDRLIGFMRTAHDRGLQIAVHALGERAIGQAVRCYGEACGGEALGARHRIEHCELPTSDHLAAMRRLGVAASVQPSFERFWGGRGGMYERRLGAERAARTNPFRTMLGAGLRLAGGSDSYVTPMDSLLGIDAAVNRPNEAERLSVFDAMSLFTSGAAWVAFDEHRRGTLEPGKEATFTVLEEDPFEIDTSRIKDVRVAALYIRGRPVSPEGGPAGKNAA